MLMNKLKLLLNIFVDAMMKALEEKLELEVSIPRKLHDEWEPTTYYQGQDKKL